MGKKILIPTDFSGHSLGLIDEVVKANSSGGIDIIFCSGYGLTMSTADLLFFSRRQILESLVPKSFTKAMEVIHNEEKRWISSIRIELFYGATESAFRSFLEGHGVDEIYVFKSYKPRFGHNSSFDITPMLVNLDQVKWFPFLGYVSNVECEESFGDQCLTKVFG